MVEAVELDVSELEPPQPLVLSLQQLERLRPGQYLHLLHRRAPCQLYEQLAARGFASETRAGRRVACELFIWRSGEEEVAAAARAAAAELPPFDEL